AGERSGKRPVAGLYVDGCREKGRVRTVVETLHDIDLGVRIAVAIHAVEDQVAGDRGEKAVARAVERHTWIALEREGNESGERIASSDQGVVGPFDTAVRRDMKEHLIEVAAEVVAHDDPPPGDRTDCGANLRPPPGGAVLVHLHVVMGRCRDKRHRPGGARRLLMQQLLCAAGWERSTVAIEWRLVVPLYPLDVRGEILERRGLAQGRLR